MLSRKIGRILRGDATPFQLFAACLLAACLGFMPGFVQAPGCIVLLTLLLILTNANLGLAALIGLGAKLASLVLMPITFAVGRALIDGPLQPLFRSAVNAPVVAFFGFEYYVTTGGLVMGLALGLCCGWLVVWSVTVFRRKMAELSKSSERFQQFTAGKWVRLLLFLFVSGSRGQKTYEDLLQRRVGNPIRPLGVLFAALVVALLGILQMFVSGPIVVMALQSGLERANGATVEIGDAEVDLRHGRLVLSGLSLADPEAPETDLFRAERIESDLSTANLLRKRLELDRVQIRDAAMGAPRATPGRRTRPAAEHPVPPSAGEEDQTARSIDDYLEDAKLWKERLARIQEWLDRITQGNDDDSDGSAKKESLKERLERQIREKGYARVRADHLVSGSPALTISELKAEKVRSAQFPNETLDVTARNLSTHPRLLGRTPEISVRSSADTFRMEAVFGQFAPERSNNIFGLQWRSLPSDGLLSKIKFNGRPPVSGGTVDVRTDGSWHRTDGTTFLSLPMEVTLRGSSFRLPGGQTNLIDAFSFPIGIEGPIADPRVRVDTGQLRDALLAAGSKEATQRLKDEAARQLEKRLDPKVPGSARRLMENLLQRKPD